MTDFLAAIRAEAAGLKPEAQRRVLELIRKLGAVPKPVVGQNGPGPASTAQQPDGQGWIEERYITKPSGRRCGPYLYRCWRENGRKRAEYLGRKK